LSQGVRCCAEPVFPCLYLSRKYVYARIGAWPKLPCWRLRRMRLPPPRPETISVWNCNPRLGPRTCPRFSRLPRLRRINPLPRKPSPLRP
jgi:hypothetical protein